MTATVFSRDERERFVTLLARCGLEANVLKALGRRPEDLEATRKADRTFAGECDFAMSLRRAEIEGEISRRGMEGWEEPVFYHGDQCGTIRKFSDQLLLALARRNIPEYRESVRVEQQHGGRVQVDHGLEGLRRLSPAAQDKLREILVEAEMAALPDAQAREG